MSTPSGCQENYHFSLSVAAEILVIVLELTGLMICCQLNRSIPVHEYPGRLTLSDSCAEYDYS
mgnify:CR=1 FL=1